MPEANAKTRLQIIREAIVSILQADSYFSTLLQDNEAGGVIIHEYSFMDLIAIQDTAVSVCHTNWEKYDMTNKSEEAVNTEGRMYIEVLVRHDNPKNAVDLCGHIMDSVRLTLMINPDLRSPGTRNGNVSKFWFMQKEMIPLKENDMLYTQVGILTMKLLYSPYMIHLS